MSALRDYEQVLKLKPDLFIQHSDSQAQGYINRGKVEVRLAEFSKNINPDKASELYRLALKDFTEAIRLNKELADGYYQRGKARSYLGDEQGAAEDLQQAADLFEKSGELDLQKDTLNFLQEIKEEPIPSQQEEPTISQ